MVNIGMTNFQNLNKFGTESLEGSKYQELQPDAPAVVFGFTFKVPNLYSDEKTNYSPNMPYDTPIESDQIELMDTEKIGGLIATLRDSILIAYYENKQLHNENLLLEHKNAVFKDSTRAFYLKREIDKSNNNKIFRHISRSLRLFYNENYRDALKEVDLAIEINPNIALAYARRGSIYYRLGDFQRATMNWNIALKLDPEFTEIHDLLKASKENRLTSSALKN